MAFDGAKTYTQLFYGPEHATNVKMMVLDSASISKRPHRFLLTQNLFSLIMPYNNNRFVAVFTRRRATEKPFSTDIQWAMEENHRHEYVRNLKMREKDVFAADAYRIFVPRFSVHAKHDGLEVPLRKAFGEDAFPDDGAEFMHTAVVEVDEKGTVAAAATVRAKGISRIKPDPLVWTGDVPFLFAIVDKVTKAVMFSALIDFTSAKGQATNPNQRRK